MTFRSIVYSALVVGLAAGLFLTLVQQFQVTPIILEAEVYEIAEAPAPAETHAHAGQGTAAQDHSHDGGEAWAPEDGTERLAYSALSNVLAAVGFALLMVSLMATRSNSSAKTGLLWGLAGYVSFFVAPALGLHPEIPGMEAAALESRQLWWTACVALTGAGLATLVYAPLKFKAGGALLIALPHLIGAPQPQTHGFSHPDPAAVAALESLAHDFIQATALANGLYWILIGVLSGLLVQRFVNRHWHAE